MKNNILKLSILALSMGLFSSCEQEKNHYEAPSANGECVNPGLAKTKEVSDIYSIAIDPVATAPSIIPNTPTYMADDIIEAYVISSDEGGNFFKSMFFQPVDGSKGFNLSVDVYNAYTQKFQPGRKVFLKLKGLAYGNPSSFTRGLVFGAPPTDKYTVDRLASLDLKKHLIPSCDIVSEDAIVKHLTLAQAMSDTYLNNLVEISDVQFKTDCATYSKQDFDTSLKIISTGSQTLDVRTSRFANFAGYPVPSGRGTIRGVLSKYNNGFQLILRTDRDVKLNGPRVATAAPALGGTNLQYTGTLTESFSGYPVGQSTVFPKYINAATVGTKYWDIASYSNNSYAQTSAFNNGCTKNYLIIPVDLTAANTFSFKTLDGYNDGVPLKVYYSTDFVPANGIAQATLVDITSKFKIADGRPVTSSKYAAVFTPSGNYIIPESLTGNGYFVFEYDGTTGITTTMELDDILIN